MAVNNAVNLKPVITGTANQITVVNASDNTTSTLSTASTQLSTTQPMFSAVLTTAGTNINATGDGTAYTVLFDTSLTNQGSNYNSATGKFTAPVTGVYLFTCGLTINNSAAVTSLEVDFTLNTGRWAIDYTSITIPLGSSQLFRGSAIIPISVGGTANVTVTATGASKTTSVVENTSANPNTYFNGWLLH